MGKNNDAWFFIGVFVFIFVIWIATGGPLRPIAIKTPPLPQLNGTGTLGGGGTFLQLPRSPYQIGSTSVELPGSALPQAQNIYPTLLPMPSFTDDIFGTPSPYRDVIRMNQYVSNPGSSDPGNEYVEISVAQNAGTSINLSGWSLLSGATGATTAITKGIKVPISGTVNATEDIVLTPGTRAILISGQSPIGASFRENKCIGYFSTFQKFSPSLPLNCPAPSNELISFYGPNYIHDSSCIEQVNKISRCQVALTPPQGVSNTCQNFVVKYLNYNGCVNAHRNDIDFTGDTWRIYLGRTNSMWRTQNEVVKLLDGSGKTVAAFSY